ncbi:uncharacterized protein LOC127752363 isoform X2 [Frankliniella occidentalis]|nr:uncharacterized protein LOC127752363 isoform X2 [Frankliniella occidentalis]
MGACVLIAATIAVRKSTSVQAAMMPITTLSSCYSGFVCLSIFRDVRFWTILQELKRLVEVMEADVCEEVWVARTRQRIVAFSLETMALAMVTAVNVLAHSFRSDDSLLPLWPFVPYAGPLGFPLARLFWGCALCTILLSINYLVIALGCATSTATGLHHALAQRLTSTASSEVLRDAVIRHQRLRHLVMDLTDFFAGQLAPVMASSFCHSLFATLQVLSNDLTTTTYTQILRVLVVFIQLSYLSQELSDASLSLHTAAYHVASSDSVSLPEERALILVMLTASRAPALRCRGLGQLSLSSAGKVLRQFYSVVNVLGGQRY